MIDIEYKRAEQDILTLLSFMDDEQRTQTLSKIHVRWPLGYFWVTPPDYQHWDYTSETLSYDNNGGRDQ